ncbi:PKD domain-containing protein [Fulvivirga sp. M361]|uniref:PKD domain-containing protein n=1 Tax=Fulvivirga sp. M361 TaxID=2594266 RepID=UPI00117AACA4|nr:PKD domain-containing protein [Fulvivirga sp. M361]TRX59527.1 PKD domain-containing protein [Fulvivirga sp. M361]
MKNFGRKLKLVSLYCAVLVVAASLMRCETDLPDVGSIADLTPPESGFSFRQDAENQLMVTFTNESQSAVNFEWDFGDGNTSMEADPVNTYGEFGTYTIRLISSDKLGVVDTLLRDIEVAEGPFQPIIFESGFEPLSPGAGGCDNGEGRSDGRDCWLNGDLGGIVQISKRSDPTQPNNNVHSGLQSVKLPGTETSERIGYQLVQVDTAQDYRLSFFYNLEDNKPGGFVTVSVLSGPVSSEEEAKAATIGSFTGTNQEDPSTFVPGSVTFNSGDSDEIAIYFFNRQSDVARLDDFTIEITQADFIPPTAAFTAEPSASNILQYEFSNSSLNAANYVWDFGDGSELSQEENPVHEFPGIDTYTVTLVAESRFFTTDTFKLDVVIPDPVAASFEYVQDPDNFLQVSFTNTSTDAESFLWNFGDGFLSTEVSPTYTFPEAGTYKVTLTATGISGITSEASEDIIVAEGFVPVILAPGFDLGNNEDTKGPWRNGDLGGVIQVSSSSDFDGGGAAKFPTSNDRIAYQEITVEANTDYILSYKYSIESQGPGISVLVAVLAGQVNDPAAISGATIASHIGENGTGRGDFTSVDIPFNSGANTTIAIYITNTGAAVGYADTFSIAEN